jgi:signal transduction histidine kinase
MRGDVLRLEQVLQNLLGNAAKYSPADGAVEVRLDRDAVEAILEVEDAGPGIPAAAQQHLFEHYRSGTPGSPISGLGVGLYIVHEIVTRHGGRIEVESAHGRGSIFRIRLPLLLPPPGTGADAPHPEPLLATPLS